MKVAVIDYNAGNIFSVILALKRLGVEPLLTNNAEEIKSADKIIFPGQGEASSAMRSLRAANLDKLIPTLTQPFFGICIGMQLLCSYSEENDTPCLGVLQQRVLRFPSHLGIKIPHVGWNTVQPYSTQIKSTDTIFNAIENESYFYFVHSYYVEIGEDTTITCDYGLSFSACMQKDNFFAAQFHPEKSGEAGEKLLKKFLSTDSNLNFADNSNSSQLKLINTH